MFYCFNALGDLKSWYLTEEEAIRWCNGNPGHYYATRDNLNISELEQVNQLKGKVAVVYGPYPHSDENR